MLQIENQLKTLMMRSLAGEATATRDLLTVLSGHLRIYFQRRTGGNADVEDLVQETLLAIHIKRETFDPHEPFTAWAYAIARHKLVDWYRQRNRRPTIPLDDAATLFTHGAYDEATAERDVCCLLSHLPEKQAIAIRCMKLEGLSAAQTAEQTGQGVAIVKVAVHRGLKRLAGMLRGSSR